jgi:phosphoribosylamine---glycine ligase
MLYGRLSTAIEYGKYKDRFRDGNYMTGNNPLNILIIGSGGREHAIAWKAAQSPRLGQLFCLPGNPGTAQVGENVVGVSVDDHPAIVRFCMEKQIDLVIIGPEIYLAAGLADILTEAGIKVFGPSRAAARIESSKVFSKDFMRRHAIPTARYESFNILADAIDYISKVNHPVVIKASGLAAGKGVILPDTKQEAREALESMLSGGVFGEAGNEVVIEERLSGQEVTLLSFSDGVTVKPMLPSQDHKRALEGDLGLNTGGMGAYAPVPACPPEMVSELVRIALQPAVDGLREEGAPFVGVLYGGFMLTSDGPRVIEFNCRFGDPETQVVLPLLENDFLEVALACTDGCLDQLDIRWNRGAAACVVLASAGYPGKYPSGFPISGLEAGSPDAIVFHAGTKCDDGRIVSAGGRVLCVAGMGADIQAALKVVYERIQIIGFEGMQYRKDIGFHVPGDR